MSIGNVPKRAWDVNDALHRSPNEGARLREWPSRPLYTFCAQDIPKQSDTGGSGEVGKGRGGVLVQRLKEEGLFTPSIVPRQPLTVVGFRTREVGWQPSWTPIVRCWLKDTFTRCLTKPATPIFSQVPIAKGIPITTNEDLFALMAVGTTAFSVMDITCIGIPYPILHGDAAGH